MLQALRLLARDDMDQEAIGLPHNRGDRHKPGRRLPLDPAAQYVVTLQAQYDLHRNLLEACPASNQRCRTSTSLRKRRESVLATHRWMSTHSTDQEQSKNISVVADGSKQYHCDF
jgi:hypothetical protein